MPSPSVESVTQAISTRPGIKEIKTKNKTMHPPIKAL